MGGEFVPTLFSFPPTSLCDPPLRTLFTLCPFFTATPLTYSDWRVSYDSSLLRRRAHFAFDGSDLCYVFLPLHMPLLQADPPDSFQANLMWWLLRYERLWLSGSQLTFFFPFFSFLTTTVHPLYCKQTCALPGPFWSHFLPGSTIAFRLPFTFEGLVSSTFLTVVPRTAKLWYYPTHKL